MNQDTRLQSTKSSRGMMVRTGFCALALISLGYAVLSGPMVGIDLQFFQQGAREWVDGVFQIGAGPIGEYPPFALPLLSPIAYVSFDKLLGIWFVLKAAAATPGVLVDRLKMTPADLSNNLVLTLGLHVERLLVFGMFWSLMFVMWKAGYVRDEAGISLRPALESQHSQAPA